MFGLQPFYMTPTADMLRGSQLERPIILEYVRARRIQESGTSFTLTFPGLLVHKELSYLAYSPDAVLQVGSDAFLIEVKTSKNALKLTNHIDQIQCGLLVSGLERAIVLFLRLLESGPVRAEMKYIDVSIVERDMVWQAKFKSNAMKVYTTFLQWIYTHPVEFDTGVKVLGVITKGSSEFIRDM